MVLRWFRKHDNGDITYGHKFELLEKIEFLSSNQTITHFWMGTRSSCRSLRSRSWFIDLHISFIE